MMATTSSSSNTGGIQKLREHEANNVLSQVDVFQRPWRSPAAGTHKQHQQPQHWQQQQRQQQNGKSSTPASCLQNASSSLCSSSASSRTTAVMMCNTAAQRPFLAAASGSSSSSGGGCGTFMPKAARPSSTSAPPASPSRSPAPAPTPASAPAPSESATQEDGGMYDPEALLLEPLLISPRSERQNSGAHGAAGIGGGICENLLHDERIMSQSMGGGNNSSSSQHHLGSGGIMGPRWEGSDEAADGGGGASFSSMHMSSFSSSSRPLVPASPSLSGAQAGSPSFIPDQIPRTGAGGRRRGGGASATSSNNGGWYLDFPPQESNQQQQQQHPHHHQVHLHHHGGAKAAGQTHSAAFLAAEAASIAAEINQAAGNVAPSSFPSAGGSSYPPIEHGMHAAVAAAGEDMMYSPGPCSGASAYDTYTTERGPASCWQTAGGHQHQQDCGNKRSTTSVDSGRSFRQPRFVTREDCVPASRFSRLAGSDAVEEGKGGGTAAGVTQQQQQQQQQQLHPHGFGIELPFPRSAEEGVMNTGGVSGWQNSSHSTSSFSSGAASQGAKRPHSQIAPASNGPAPCSSSSAPSAVGVGGGATQLPARLTPMMLSAQGQQGHGGKKMKVLCAANGSQGWAKLSRGRGGGDGSTGTGMTVMVPGPSSPMDCSGSGSGTPTPTEGSSRRRSGRSGSGAVPSPAEAAAAARAALAATFPPTPSSQAGGGGEEDSNGDGDDSSPDWTERDEFEEEEVASPAPGTGSGNGGGAKTKTPFMLDPKLWTVVERRAVCTAKQCAYRSEDDHRSRRRHYHALCSHVHQNGERKGMRFQHHQLEKVQKHQRAHQNTQRSAAGKPRSPISSPVPRAKRVAATNGQKEQTRAIKDANVEAHSPKDWTPESTKRLRELVDELGPKWSSIAEKIPGKTATACMLHWRVGLNPNHMVKGSGTWTAEEDERLSKLVEVVGMKWSDLARHIPGRIAKQCRERYLNHLDPSLRKDVPWTEDEEALLMRLCFAKQNQWAEICRQLHGRSYNDVKNRFNLIQRRNKRAQGGGTPTTPSTPATPGVPLAAASDVKPVRRGNRESAADAAAFNTSSASNGSGSGRGGGALYGGSALRTRGGGSTASAVNSSAFASARAMAAGGWGPAAAAAAAANASAVSAIVHGGSSSSSSSSSSNSNNNGSGHDHDGHGHGNCVPSEAAATSSSLGLMGDELGEFGLDGSEAASPGSGFAPGGYWHQVVKEEARVARESDEESAKSGKSCPASDHPPPVMSSLEAAGGGGEGGEASVVDPSPTGRATRFSQNGSPMN